MSFANLRSEGKHGLLRTASVVAAENEKPSEPIAQRVVQTSADMSHNSPSRAEQEDSNLQEALPAEHPAESIDFKETEMPLGECSKSSFQLAVKFLGISSLEKQNALAN